MLTLYNRKRFHGALTLLIVAQMLAVVTASRRRLPDIGVMRQEYFGGDWNDIEVESLEITPMAGFMACKEWQQDQLEKRHEAALGPVDCPECGDDSPEECRLCDFSGKITVNPEDYPVFPTMVHVRQIAEYRAQRNQTYKDMSCGQCRDVNGRKNKVSLNKIAEALKSAEQQLPTNIAQVVAGYLPCFACDGSGLECSDVKAFLKDPARFKIRLENDLREACRQAWHQRVELSPDMQSDLGTTERIHREQVSSETADRFFGSQESLIRRRWNRAAVRERQGYITTILRARQQNVTDKRARLAAFLDYENPGLPIE